MKKKTIVFLVLGLVLYGVIIWLVRTNDTAKTIAKWVCGVAMAIWGIDFFLGQFAGLISKELQERMAAFFMVFCVVMLVLFPLFIAVIVR